MPVLISGTSSEFLGSKPLPRALTSREVLFFFGPSGVGKTMVARRVLGEDTLLIDQQSLNRLVSLRIRTRRWPKKLDQVNKLIIEVPCFLDQRPQVFSLLRSLIQTRIRSGFRTAILDAEDDGPVHRLMRMIHRDERATLVLRFPEGKGRYRFALRACREHSLPLSCARWLAQLDSWNYTRMFGAMEKMVVERLGAKE